MIKHEAIPCGPQLTDLLKSRAGIDLVGSDFVLTSSISGVETQLAKHDGIFTDENQSWAPDESPLTIYGRIKIKDMRKLKGTGGIAAKNADLRVALSWSSIARDLVTGAFRMQGVIEPDEELDTPDRFGKIYVFRHTFPPASIRGSLTLSPFIYIKTPDPKPSPEDAIFVNEMGYRFGPPIRTIEYQFVKDDLMFPILEVQKKDAPLWWIDINPMEDPAKDPFEMSLVRICINTEFPGFETLVKKNGQKALLMLHIDILSTAYYLLIEYLRSHEKQADFWPLIATGEDLEQNSVAGVISLFVRTSGININEKKGCDLYKGICDAMRKMLGGTR